MLARCAATPSRRNKEVKSNLCMSGAELLMPRHNNNTVPTSAIRASVRVLVRSFDIALVGRRLARVACQPPPLLGSSILESFRPLWRHHGRLFLAVAQGGPLQDSESRVAGRGSRGQPSVQNTRRVSVRRCDGARRVEVSRFPGCCNVVLFVCRARSGASQQLRLVASVVSGGARSRIQARREVGKGSMRGMLKDTQSAPASVFVVV
jgi:hypothetical protein